MCANLEELGDNEKSIRIYKNNSCRLLRRFSLADKVPSGRGYSLCVEQRRRCRRFSSIVAGLTVTNLASQYTITTPFPERHFNASLRGFFGAWGPFKEGGFSEQGALEAKNSSQQSPEGSPRSFINV